jgi:Spy/CpxP family protein refolding chaperone
MGVGLATYSEAIMRYVIFLLLLAVSLQAKADSFWGDYGDIGPRGYHDNSDYLVYGSQAQQLNNIRNELMYQQLDQEEYQRKALKEMREANRLRQEALDQQERNYRRSRPFPDDF